MIQFETPAQQAVYDKIQPWMKELFGEFAIAREDDPVFGIFIGSAFAQCVVFPWGEDATITTRAYVVSGAELTNDLLHHLLRQNTEKLFGAFGLDEQSNIVFEHSIVGSTCDKEELKASVMAVVRVADIYDDQIVSRWGGQRAIDRMRWPW